MELINLLIRLTNNYNQLVCLHKYLRFWVRNDNFPPNGIGLINTNQFVKKNRKTFSSDLQPQNFQQTLQMLAIFFIISSKTILAESIYWEWTDKRVHPWRHCYSSGKRMWFAKYRLVFGKTERGCFQSLSSWMQE